MKVLSGPNLPFRTRLISASLLYVKYNFFCPITVQIQLLFFFPIIIIIIIIIIYIPNEYNYGLLYSPRFIRAPYSCCHATLLPSKKCCVTKATPCSTPIYISFLFRWIRVTRALGTRSAPFSSPQLFSFTHDSSYGLWGQEWFLCQIWRHTTCLTGAHAKFQNELSDLRS